MCKIVFNNYLSIFFIQLINNTFYTIEVNTRKLMFIKIRQIIII